MTSNVRVRKTDRHPGRVATLVALAALSWGLVEGPSVAKAAPITQTVTHTVTIPLTPTDWSPGNPAGIPSPFPLPKFDPNLGTLLSVTLSAGATFEHQVDMTFLSPATLTATATNNIITIRRQDGSTLTTLTIPDDVRTESYAGPTFPREVHFPPKTLTTSFGPVTLTSPADLALYTAKTPGETLPFPTSASARSSFSTNSGNGFGGVNTRAGASLTVSYEYAVPEPSTLAILGIGAALAFGTLARRRVG